MSRRHPVGSVRSEKGSDTKQETSESVVSTSMLWLLANVWFAVAFYMVLIGVRSDGPLVRLGWRKSDSIFGFGSKADELFVCGNVLCVLLSVAHGIAAYRRRG
jgi:hypothetical protein